MSFSRQNTICLPSLRSPITRFPSISEKGGLTERSTNGLSSRARSIGCPAVCRDEIKEGMAYGSPEFAPSPGDELTVRTLPVFFGVLELLVRAGVTTVAEAAFQDHVWRPRLAPLRDLAHLRIVHCIVDTDVAVQRMMRRREEHPLRRVHADPRPEEAETYAEQREAFRRVSLDAPWIEVDTTDGYKPGLAEIVAFVADAN